MMIKRKLLGGQAYDAILGLIRKHNFRVGDVFLSRQEIMNATKLSQRPVQQAIQKLAKEGVFNTVRGSGCYITRLPDAQPEQVALERPPRESLGEASSYFSLSRSVHFKMRLRLGIIKEEWNAYSDLWRGAIESYLDTHKGIGIEVIPFNLQELTADSMHLFDMVQIPADTIGAYATGEQLFDLRELGFDFKDSRLYPPLVEAATCDSKILGLPHIAATNCYYCQPESVASLAIPGDNCDFWGLLELLKRHSTEKPFAKFASMLMNTYPLNDLYREADPDAGWVFHAENIALDDKFKHFLESLAPFFTDRRVFHHGYHDYSFYNNRELFWQKRVCLINGNSCWSSDMRPPNSPPPEILPVYHSRGCAAQINAIVNSVCHYAPYPKECLEFLSHLSGEKALSVFAKHGRLTSNSAANTSLLLEGYSEDSCEALRWNLRHGRVLKVEDQLLRNSFQGMLNCEFLKWQEGKISTEDLLKELIEKSHYFLRSLRKRPAKLPVPSLSKN
ncbi:MAG: GntR family transcriptional regulator [Lentisphaerae bacterium]|nr:GntR family transcriptional regulator [Lentisphaerota bacterium]